MGRKPKVETPEANETVVEKKEKAAVSRERKLALALRAVLDETSVDSDGNKFTEAFTAGSQLLNELGYGDLESIHKRVAALTAELNAAITAQDYKEVSRLGLELERAKTGAKVRVSKNGSGAE